MNDKIFKAALIFVSLPFQVAFGIVLGLGTIAIWAKIEEIMDK